MMTGRFPVLLVVPPFASVAMPALGVSTLKSQLNSRGISSKIIYSNVLVSNQFGNVAYQEVADSDVRLMRGETLCALSDADWALKIEKPDWLYEQHLARVPRLIKEQLDATIEMIVQLNPAIVGLSTTFQQTAASVIIARGIKKKLVEAKVVVGGANVDYPMADGFEAKYGEYFDHIFSGEADLEFPNYCCNVLDGRVVSQGKKIRCYPVNAPEFSVVPDFSDFFEQGGGETQLEVAGERVIPIEFSRGCWWGQKHHCTFCGLNANGMLYRAKAQEMISAEISSLVDAYDPELFFASDNILSRDAFSKDFGLPKKGAGKHRFFLKRRVT